MAIEMIDVTCAATMPTVHEAMQHLHQIAGVEVDGEYIDDLWESYSEIERMRCLLDWMKTEELEG